MKKKVFLTRTFPDFEINELKKHYNIEIHRSTFTIPKKKLLKKIKNKDGLICYPYDIIDKQVISTGNKLKTISTFSVGYDHIDTEFAKKKKNYYWLYPKYPNNSYCRSYNFVDA